MNGERRMNRSCEPVSLTDTPLVIVQTAIRKFRQLGGKKTRNEDSTPKQAERDFLSLFVAINGNSVGGVGAEFFTRDENISDDAA